MKNLINGNNITKKNKDNKLLNFKLSKACHDLSRTVGGTSNSRLAKRNKSNKSLLTSRTERSGVHKSFSK